MTTTGRDHVIYYGSDGGRAEAYEDGGKLVGVVTTLAFVIAFAVNTLK